MADLADGWERLADELGASPFERPGWAARWWDAFGRGTLRVFTSGESSPRALLPMRRVGRSLSSLTNWHSHASGLLASDPAAVDALVTSLLAERPQQLTLRFLDSDAWSTRALADGLRAAGYDVVQRPLVEQAFVTISGTFEAYEATVSRNVREDVRRRRRRLEGMGAVTLDVEDGTQRLDQLLDEGFAVEGSGWKSAAGTAISSAAETDSFYRSISSWAAGNGNLRLFYLRLDGRCIAFDLALLAGGALFGLKGGYDPALAQYSPGKLLQAATLRHAFEVGLSRYEFLGAAERHKLQWATGTRRTVTLRAFAPTLVGRSLGAADRYARPFGRRARALLKSLAAR